MQYKGPMRIQVTLEVEDEGYELAEPLMRQVTHGEFYLGRNGRVKQWTLGVAGSKAKYPIMRAKKIPRHTDGIWKRVKKWWHWRAVRRQMRSFKLAVRLVRAQAGLEAVKAKGDVIRGCGNQSAMTKYEEAVTQADSTLEWVRLFLLAMDESVPGDARKKAAEDLKPHALDLLDMLGYVGAQVPFDDGFNKARREVINFIVADYNHERREWPAQDQTKGDEE